MILHVPPAKGPWREEGTAQEGKAVAAPESQRSSAKWAGASTASKGGDTEDTSQGPRLQSRPLPRDGPCLVREQND